MPHIAFFFIVTISFFMPLNIQAQEGRFVHEGNGKISIKNTHTGQMATVRYRDADGTYGEKALSQINGVFGMPSKNLGENISLRLIATLDYLEDRFSPGETLILLSGFRSEAGNNRLRKRGRPAAKTSYHLEGMAADVVFPGASAHKIWETVRSLDCCGVGFYSGRSVHIDTGKPRFWTAETALSHEKEHAPNKNIYLSTDYDVYLPGETIRLFLSGISDYPFGIKSPLKLVGKGGGAIIMEPQFHNSKTIGDSNCLVVNNRKDARLIYWKIPDEKKVKPGIRQIQMSFCGHDFKTMPAKILSRPFRIKK